MVIKKTAKRNAANTWAPAENACVLMWLVPTWVVRQDDGAVIGFGRLNGKSQCPLTLRSEYMQRLCEYWSLKSLNERRVLATIHSSSARLPPLGWDTSPSGILGRAPPANTKREQWTLRLQLQLQL